MRRRRIIDVPKKGIEFMNDGSVIGDSTLFAYVLVYYLDNILGFVVKNMILHSVINLEN